MTNGQGGSAILLSNLDALDGDKQRLRAQARQNRSNFHQASGSTASTGLADVFLANIPTPVGTIAAAYWPMDSEIDPRPLCNRIRQTGLTTALPVVVNRNAPLIFRVWDDGTELAEGPYGTRQPPDDASETVPNLLIVPLLAFDPFCSRLGYGGGYYDRTLAGLAKRAPIRAIGVGFAGQQVDRVPVGPHDTPLDAVVTERGILYPPVA